MKPQISVNRLVILAAVFLTTFANVALFRNLAGAISGQPNAMLQLVCAGLVVLCVLILFLLLFSLRRIIKPALILLVLLSAFTAYFMDTHHVVIDREVMANFLASNPGGSFDLVTGRLVMYVLLMAVVPSYLIWDIEIVRVTLRQAFLSRLKLASVAGMTLIVVVLIFNSFFTSFADEHKLLLNYANPLAPLCVVFDSMTL